MHRFLYPVSILFWEVDWFSGRYITVHSCNSAYFICSFPQKNAIFAGSYDEK